MNENPKVPYVSVIKLNGKPILPPLITPEVRKELLNYKHQAIKLEKLLKNCNDLKKNVQQLLESRDTTSQLSFGDNSHIEALNISKKLKNVQLSKDLIEVTEYNGNGLKLIENNDKDKFRYRSYSVSVPAADFRKPSTPPKPRLIRSNSYTLDSPSPILLEHLKKASLVNNTTIDKSVEDIKSPTIEVYQTDISVQQITVNSNKEVICNKNPFETDSELIEALKDIPENYANQILDLVKQQHVEQKERLERYDRQNVSDNLIDFSSFIETRPNTGDSAQNDKLKRSSTFSMSPSQSLYYSLTSDSSVPSLQLNDNKLEWEGYLMHNNSGCSRELFPKIETIQKEWAASVISAHVKGFLTRRLLKTDKVQSLIATVKEVLVCALELHRADNIDEKDVELHRRLINQLSAALYAFHDVFFELSTREQMALISADRQRKIDKLKRPQSKHKLISESPQSLTKV